MVHYYAFQVQGPYAAELRYRVSRPLRRPSHPRGWGCRTSGLGRGTVSRADLPLGCLDEDIERGDEAHLFD